MEEGLAEMKEKKWYVQTAIEMVRYPKWLGEQPRGEEKFGGHGRGLQQGGCTLGKGRNGNVSANATHINGEIGAAMNLHNNNTLPGQSNDQWQALLNFLNSHKGNKNNKMTGKDCGWIIDTGTSNHMTGNIKLLHEVREIT